MNPDTFINTVVTQGNRYLVVKGQGWIKHIPFDTTEKLKKLLDKYNKYDLYIALASFKKQYLPDGTTDRSRGNVDTLKSFFADIDFKQYGGSPYKTYRALLKFCKEHFLEPSVVVNSGGGIHVYWLLDSPTMNIDLWRFIGQNLAEMMHEHGVLCDQAVTYDASRILRIPGTYNYKYPDAPRMVRTVRETGTVYSLDEVRGKLPVTRQARNVTSLRPTPGAAGDPDDLTAGLPALPPVDMMDVLKECPVMREAEATGGAGHSRDGWFYLLTIAAASDDPSTWAHKISDKHPTYAHDEVEKELERIKTRGVGPAKCETIAREFNTICAGCKHRPKNSTPAMASRWVGQSKQGQPLQSHTPGPSSRPPTVYDMSRNQTLLAATGAWVCDGEIINVYEAQDPHNTEASYILVFEWRLKPGRDKVFISLSPAAVHRHLYRLKEEILKVGGPAPNMYNADTMREAAQSWIGYLRASGAKPGLTTIGWDDTCDNFNFSGDVLTRPGKRATGAFDIKEFKLPARGDLQDNVDMFNMYLAAETRIEGQVMLAVALGAPFVAFTPSTARPAPVNVYGQNNVGKTTIAELAQMVFTADPPDGLVLPPNRTPAATNRKTANVRDMVLVVEELVDTANVNTLKATEDLLYGQTGSTGRVTSSVSAGGTNATDTTNVRNTMMMLTNISVLGVLSSQSQKTTNASNARIFEFGLDQVRNKSENDFAQFKHYKRKGFGGVIGREIVRRILAEKPTKLRENVDALKSKYEERVRRHPKSDPQADCRFHGSLAAVVAMGAAFGKQLGLDLDPKRIWEFMVEQGARQHAVNATSFLTVDRVIKDMFDTSMQDSGEMWVRMKRSDKAHKQHEERFFGRNPHSPREPYCVFCVEDRKILIPLRRLNEYIDDKRITDPAQVKSLFPRGNKEVKGPVQKLKVRPSKGTDNYYYVVDADAVLGTQHVDDLVDRWNKATSNGTP